MNPRKRSVLQAAGGAVLSLGIIVVFFTPRTGSEWRLCLAVVVACFVGGSWGSWRR